jgi:hypothetical protein
LIRSFAILNAGAEARASPPFVLGKVDYPKASFRFLPGQLAGAFDF